eukprot:TRINITY_DN2532_c0_g1_i1.p1 TRINITY_DN2532_c0_g1~~TRINITY_DN2532_c0_g1_i1.p1  ORF type:complete len:317 (-),score=41.12 TRINITY_DN2532_c0_g1_i1:31-981(-)
MTDSGEVLWNKKVDKLSSQLPSCNMYLKIAGELVVCHGKGAVAALNKNTGDVLWSANLHGADNVSSVVVGNTLYTGSNGHVYSISMENGHKNWKNPLSGKDYQGVSLLHHQINSESLLLCGTFGYIVVLNPTDGKKLKEINLKGTGYHPVSMVSDGSRIIAASGGTVFALDSTTLEIIWKNDLPGLGSNHGFSLVPYTTSISKENVILVGFNGHLICLNSSNGETHWKHSLKSSGYSFVSMIIMDNLLIVGSSGHLYVINPDSGIQMKKDNLKGLGFNLVTICSNSENAYNMDENSQNILSYLEEMQQDNANNSNS